MPSNKKRLALPLISRRALIAGPSAALLLAAFAPRARAATVTLLNVSYDVARELYKEINPAFVKHWKASTARTSPSTSRTAARASRRAR
jgi:sulfate/thiosulfate transport system substrate-binding protein